jgi:tRNA pseudouridine38-40 synthase
VRLAVGIEYAGARYAGWQRQTSAPSVQTEVERALAKIAAHPVETVCAGRTDAGVHAVGQVAHFDTEAVRSDRGWVLGTNVHLPSDIALSWVARVGDDFSARYSALARTYRYVILNRPTRAPLLADRVCFWRTPLDVDRMQAALLPLVGLHDFSAFRAAQCQSRVAIRRLDRIEVRRSGEFVTIEVTANAFLHHMVRNIAGSALAVGGGDRDPEWLASVLAGRDRRLAGPTAPPGGLYFLAAHYPPGCGIVERALPGLSAMIGALGLPAGTA